MLLLVGLLTCASPDLLDRELDAKLLRLRPGLTLAEISHATDAPLEFLIPQDGKVLVHLMASQQHRIASVLLMCRLDADQRLSDCSVEMPRDHTQVVTQGQHDALRKGQPVAAVIAALCLPEAVTQLPGGEFQLSYSRELPPDAFIPYHRVFLRFGKDGRLKDKNFTKRGLESEPPSNEMQRSKPAQATELRR